MHLHRFVSKAAPDTLGHTSPFSLRYKRITFDRNMEQIMKRLFTIFFFLAGGLAAELTHPLQCSLIPSSVSQQKRRKRHTLPLV